MIKNAINNANVSQNNRRFKIHIEKKGNEIRSGVPI